MTSVFTKWPGCGGFTIRMSVLRSCSVVVLEVKINNLFPLDTEGEPPVPCDVEAPDALPVARQSMGVPDRDRAQFGFHILVRSRGNGRPFIRPSPYNWSMSFDDYKVVLYRQDDGSWVAEIPAVGGCYALMDTREAALIELERVFGLITEEHQERGESLPKDTTEIVHA